MAELSKLQAHLLERKSQSYNSYYNGKMSYALHGKNWKDYVAKAFPDLAGSTTSENVFKSVIDLYAENLVPMPDELRGFSNSLVPLLSRGEAVVAVDPAGEAHFPEHFEVLSDGRFTVALIFSRKLDTMLDYLTFIDSNGKTQLYSKPVPDDLGEGSRDKDGWTLVEEPTGWQLIRFALDDKGFGASLAALQDRINHSIIDLTIVAEMYARPFWYLLNVSLSPKNPYLPPGMEADDDAMTEQNVDEGGGRIFTTSGEGPFGQLDPPTISDMIGYHDSISDKVSQTTGIPQFYFKPGSGTPPTGVALKVLSKRFNNKIARMREDIKPAMEELAALLGVERTVEVEGQAEREYELWDSSDDLLQDALDAHGLSLVAMGYPLKYIAEVVTPGVDLDDYLDDTDGQPAGPALGSDPQATEVGSATDPQAGPAQIQAYAENPGQKAR